MKYLIIFLAFVSTAAHAQRYYEKSYKPPRSYTIITPSHGYQGTWQRQGNTWNLYTPHGGYQGMRQRDGAGNWNIYTPSGGYKGSLYPQY